MGVELHVAAARGRFPDDNPAGRIANADEQVVPEEAGPVGLLALREPVEGGQAGEIPEPDLAGRQGRDSAEPVGADAGTDDGLGVPLQRANVQEATAGGGKVVEVDRSASGHGHAGGTERHRGIYRGLKVRVDGRGVARSHGQAPFRQHRPLIARLGGDGNGMGHLERHTGPEVEAALCCPAGGNDRTAARVGADGDVASVASRDRTMSTKKPVGRAPGDSALRWVLHLLADSRTGLPASGRGALLRAFPCSRKPSSRSRKVGHAPNATQRAARARYTDSNPHPFVPGRHPPPDQRFR